MRFHLLKKVIKLINAGIKKILVSGNFTYCKNKEKDAKNLIEHNSDKKYDNYLSTFHK